MSQGLPLDFKKLVLARFLFNISVRIQAVVVGWTMYDLTHDPLKLGMVGLAEALPALSLAPLAGYLVDRSRPVRMYGLVLLFSLLSALVVFYAQFNLAPADHVFALFLASVLTGTARSLAQPSVFATVPRLVARSELSRATASMSSVQQIGSVIGPAMGGLLYSSSLPPTGLASLLLGFSLICVLSIPAPPAQKPEARLPLTQELLLGARFIFSHSLLLPALALDMFSVMFAGVTALLPMFAGDVLHVGAGGLGLLRAAPALGASLVAFWLTRLNFQEKAGRYLFLAVSGFGLCILGFGLSHNVWLSGLLLFLSGAFDSVSAVIRNTAVQLASPDSMRGRISAINSMFIGSSNELGEFESGLVAKFLGPVGAVLFGAGACFVTIGLVWLFSPGLRRLNLRQLEQAASC
ncbi:MAG: MFS transporter [Candidatus Eremiobacteraeota bacterium]|nr:MFS transporter [Candidatus Eremiobacteraeota bacterium]MCW5866834.1 MFS transporter [Candidatus Eremiobacteraeota bacterium]